MRPIFSQCLLFVCLVALSLAACSPKLAELPASTAGPLPDSAPTTALATAAVQPSPEPSLTPGPTATPALILPPVARFLPDAEDTGPDYQPVVNQVADNLVYFDQLPLSKENLGTANLEYRGANDLTGAQAGIYMRMSYWVAVAPDEASAKFYYQMSRSDQFLKQAFVVIMPASMQEKMGEVTRVEPGKSVCDEAAIGTEAFDLFADYRSGQIPTRNPAVDPHNEWYKPEQIAKFPPDLYIYASCRVKNAVVLFWGWTMNNYDGKYAPLPAEVVAEQVNQHFAMVVKT